MGIEFVEVLSSTEEDETNHAQFEIELKGIESKVNKTDSPEANAALQAAIEFLEEKNSTNNTLVQKPNWGIYTYFYNNQKCDYQKADSLENGQDYYRKRGEQDTAIIFVANGEVTRSKGDQVAIETCTGRALMDGNLKQKTFDPKSIFVVNHESNSIYNDIVKFDKDRMNDAIKQFNNYPKNDSTILIRGSDSQVIKKKGEEKFVAQNLAYIYNDKDSEGKSHDKPMSADIAKVPEQQK